MSDIAPYRIILEQDCKGRWHWKVGLGRDVGVFLKVPGFFNEYGFGSARKKGWAEKDARRFVKLHNKMEEKEAADKVCREKTREVLQ